MERPSYDRFNLTIGRLLHESWERFSSQRSGLISPKTLFLLLRITKKDKDRNEIHSYCSRTHDERNRFPASSVSFIGRAASVINGAIASDVCNTTVVEIFFKNLPTMIFRSSLLLHTVYKDLLMEDIALRTISKKIAINPTAVSRLEM